MLAAASCCPRMSVDLLSRCLGFVSHTHGRCSRDFSLKITTIGFMLSPHAHPNATQMPKRSMQCFTPGRSAPSGNMYTELWSHGPQLMLVSVGHRTPEKQANDNKQHRVRSCMFLFANEAKLGHMHACVTMPLATPHHLNFVSHNQPPAAANKVGPDRSLPLGKALTCNMKQAFQCLRCSSGTHNTRWSKLMLVALCCMPIA